MSLPIDEFLDKLIELSKNSDDIKKSYNEILSFQFEENLEKRIEFTTWISEHFKEIQIIDKLEDILPTKMTLENLIKKGYQHKPTQCHYSAKAISIIDNSFEYCTGFVINNARFFNFIPHSFNICNGKIFDFSKVNSDLSIFPGMENKFPITYYGAKIDNEFVKRYKEETLSKYSMKPLLFEWFSNKKVNL